MLFFFCKQKTAYDVRISDGSSDVCSSDLARAARPGARQGRHVGGRPFEAAAQDPGARAQCRGAADRAQRRSRGAGRRDRKSVVSGKSVSVRVDLGGRRLIKKKIGERKSINETV